MNTSEFHSIHDFTKRYSIDRNMTFLIIISLFTLINSIVNILIGIPLSAFFVFLCLQLITIIVFALMMFHSDDGVKFSARYVIVFFMFSNIFLTSFYETASINLFFIILFPISITLYQDLKSFYLTSFLSTATIILLRMVTPELFSFLIDVYDFFYILVLQFFVMFASWRQIITFQTSLSDVFQRQTVINEKSNSLSKANALNKTNFENVSDFSLRLESHVAEVRSQINSVRDAIHQMNDAAQTQNISIEKLFLDSKNVQDHTVVDLVKNVSNLNQQNATILGLVEGMSSSMEKLLFESGLLQDSFKSSIDNNHLLFEKMEEIKVVLTFIQNLSNKIGILSINASIEAAKSTDGAGFEVVAREVRSLSDESLHASKNVKKILQDAFDEMRIYKGKLDESEEIFKRTFKLINTVQGSNDQIVNHNRKSVDETNGIYHSILSFENTFLSINKEISEISSTSEENEAMLEELTMNSLNMYKEMDALFADFDQLRSQIQKSQNEMQ